jgi:hypothetical protein
METNTTPLPPAPSPAASVADQLWTCDEVAAFLRCTVRHVHNLLRRGLPHVYVGRLLRFDPVEIRAYLLKYRRFGRRA